MKGCFVLVILHSCSPQTSCFNIIYFLKNRFKKLSLLECHSSLKWHKQGCGIGRNLFFFFFSVLAAVVPENPRYVQADPLEAAVFGAVLRTGEARWWQEVCEQLTPRWPSTPGALAAHAAHTWAHSPHGRSLAGPALPGILAALILDVEWIREPWALLAAPGDLAREELSPQHENSFLYLVLCSGTGCWWSRRWRSLMLHVVPCLWRDLGLWACFRLDGNRDVLGWTFPQFPSLLYWS